MKQVQQALSGLDIPVYAGIWRPTVGQQNPPAQYAVYATTTTEDVYLDDAVVSLKTFVYLNLWSDGDPTDTASRIRSAMYNAGFVMVEETDMGYNQPAYDSATRQYNVHWTWCLRAGVCP